MKTTGISLMYFSNFTLVVWLNKEEEETEQDNEEIEIPYEVNGREWSQHC